MKVDVYKENDIDARRNHCKFINHDFFAGRL